MYSGFSAKLLILLHLAGIAAFSASTGTDSQVEANCADKGDIAFRKSDFGAAESYYRKTLAENGACARALLGLGRIEELNFRRAAARDHFASAFRLAPRDPKIIRSYASVVADSDSEALLLRNYVASGGEGLRGADFALGHIELHRRLGRREVDTLETPYQSYSFPMSPSLGSLRPAGMVLRVSINGGKPLRLIFDTGARGILLRSKAAEKLGLEILGSSAVRGVGAGEPAKAWIGLAQSIRIENLRMRNCLIEVSGGLPPGDDDGVIGAAMFQRFLIRFNAGDKLLELLPFLDPMPGPAWPERPWHGHDRVVPPGMEGFSKAHQVGHLLLVSAKVNRERFGYFLLDTGSAFSSLSLELAGWGGAQTGAVPVSGMSGRAEGAVRVSPVMFQIARASVVDTSPVAFDLREMSRREGVEISGLIGYPAISQGVLTINYRDGLIDIAPRK